MPYLRPYTGEHSLSREGNDISQSEWELKMKLSELETSCVLSIQWFWRRGRKWAECIKNSEMELKGEFKNAGNRGVVPLSRVSNLACRMRGGGDREKLSMKAWKWQRNTWATILMRLFRLCTCFCLALSLLTLIMNINSQHSHIKGTAIEHLALSSTWVFLSYLYALLSLGNVGFYWFK